MIEIFEFQKRSYFVFEKKGKLKRARCCYKCALEPGRGICTPQTTHGKLIPFKWTSVQTPHSKKTGTGNDRYSGHGYSGIDRYSGQKPLTTQFYLLLVESPL